MKAGCACVSWGSGGGGSGIRKGQLYRREEGKKKEGAEPDLNATGDDGEAVQVVLFILPLLLVEPDVRQSSHRTLLIHSH